MEEDRLGARNETAGQLSGAREDLHSPSVEIFASPSASSQAARHVSNCASQVESYSSAIRREEFTPQMEIYVGARWKTAK